jgi:Nickel responsive protein SCO4226-like
MPRYLIERDFPEGLQIPVNEAGARLCAAVIENNCEAGVTWVQSYVTPDRRRSFCIYDGPTPEAVRRASSRNKLPITRITEVRVLDPYFYIDR